MKLQVRGRGPGAWAVTLKTERCVRTLWISLPQYTVLLRKPQGGHDFYRYRMPWEASRRG